MYKLNRVHWWSSKGGRVWGINFSGASRVEAGSLAPVRVPDLLVGFASSFDFGGEADAYAGETSHKCFARQQTTSNQPSHK